MRLHGSLCIDAGMTKPLRAYAVDGDDNDQPVLIELKVVGNQVRLVPVQVPVGVGAEEEITASTAMPDAVPVVRQHRIDGNDFS